MNNKKIFGWNYQITNYNKGDFLLGFNLNSNNDFTKRETYLIIYLGKFSLIIGKFHKFDGDENE